MTTLQSTAIDQKNNSSNLPPVPPIINETSSPLTTQKIGDATQVVFKEKNNNKNASISGLKGTVVERFSPVILGNDIFTLGFTGLTAATNFLPSLASNPAITSVMSVCGVVSGGIMTFSGIMDLKAGIEKLKNGDKEGYGKLLVATGITEIILGLVLIAYSLLLIFAPHAAITQWIATNPWLLASLFLAPAVFTLTELGRKGYKAATNKDFFGTLQIDKLLKDVKNASSYYKKQAKSEEKTQPEKTQLAQNNSQNLIKQANEEKELLESLVNFLNITLGIKIEKEETSSAETILAKLQKELEKKLPEFQTKLDAKLTELEKEKAKLSTSSQEKLTNKIEEIKKDQNNNLLFMFLAEQTESLAENMGVEGAIHAGSLIQPMIQLLESMKNNKPEEFANKIEALNLQTKIEELKKDHATWNKILLFRTLVQILYIVAFIVSMSLLGLKDGPTKNYINGAENSILALANFIPLVIDGGFPFIRGTPVVPASVDLKKMIMDQIQKEEEEKKKKSLNNTQPQHESLGADFWEYKTVR